MTTRKDVSVIQNRWHDAQRVDRTDMEVEQEYNNQTNSAIVQNHFGSGVVLTAPEQVILFDSDNLNATQASLLAAGNFDGTGLDAHAQPSDINLGNQIEVSLTDSNVFGRLSIKVVIIGLSFDGTLQYDRFYFYRNETQTTSRHYARILTIMFNDFKGNNNCSRNNGGRIVIKECASFQLSIDPIMVAQDVEPNIFWRDFKVADQGVSLFDTIQSGIGSEYSVDSLSINVTGRQSNRVLVANDVTSQIGQKFKAYTDNIQKITLLLGAQRDNTASIENRYDWAGDLVISIYPLQTTVSCPTAIVPGLAIEFDPDSEPLVQLSYNQESLKDIGYILTDIAQPVDFVFNSTKVGSGSTSNITPGNFYAITIKRSGAATSGTLFVEAGNNRIEDSRTTLFSGVWVDVTEEDLWFQIWTDAAKVADGNGYDNGSGIQYEKTTLDTETGTTIDNEVRYKSFSNTGENILNIGVLQATTEETTVIQDERTGNNVFSRQKSIPSFSFVSESDLEELQETSEPLIIGCVKDTNPKQNSLLEKTQSIPGLASGDSFCVINPDPDLLSLNLLGSKIIPNYPCSESYRIFKVEYCIDGYGDVNGDGNIDQSDISAAALLLGESLYYESTQQKIVDGYFTTLELLRADVDGDGYISSNDLDLITQYVNNVINSFPVGTSFDHVCFTLQQSTGRYDGYFDCDGYIRLDGYIGNNIIDPGTLDPNELLYDGYLSPVVLETDTVFTTVPFPGVTYRIVPQPYWQPHLVGLNTDARLIPVAFTYDTSPTQNSCSLSGTYGCQERPDLDIECDPGRNDFMVPNNLIIGNGQILNRDGTNHIIDLEIGTIILQLPDDPLEEVSLNVFEKLVMDSNDTGKTVAGYPAMRYADCSTVQPEDLVAGKIKFSVAIQAIVPEFDGYDTEGVGGDGYGDGYGIVIDDIIAVYIDHSTGILTLTAKDMYVNSLFRSQITKLEITVYLKKGGWNQNNLTIVEPSEIAGLLST